MSRVIVTGAAGYIGGQTVLNLLDQGHSVMGIDNVMPPHHLVDCGAKWYIGNFADELELNAIKTFNPTAIIHCAGTSLVGPSIMNPSLYYENNFVATKRLLDYLVDHKLTDIRVIFSSSAATYGEPIMVPCQEEDPTIPISPYGESKLMIEFMLKAYSAAYGLDFVAFRYFNACGADHLARHGQAPNATHIIARVLESIRDNQPFTLNGNTYNTSDGTCVRDYIHVKDIADAHIRAMDHDVPMGIYNLGTNQGASNQQIISLSEEITGQKVNLNIGPIRPGDPAVLTASADRFIQVSKWNPQYTLRDMIQHAWNWYTR